MQLPPALQGPASMGRGAAGQSSWAGLMGWGLGTHRLSVSSARWRGPPQRFLPICPRTLLSSPEQGPGRGGLWLGVPAWGWGSGAQPGKCGVGGVALLALGDGGPAVLGGSWFWVAGHRPRLTPLGVRGWELKMGFVHEKILLLSVY